VQAAYFLAIQLVGFLLPPIYSGGTVMYRFHSEVSVLPSQRARPGDFLKETFLLGCLLAASC
jgi:hypothetical protein